MNAGIIARDIWLRHTSPIGTSYVQCHRVWDADRFVASQQDAADDLNAKQEPGSPRKARVDQITEDQFNTERKPRS